MPCKSTFISYSSSGSQICHLNAFYRLYNTVLLFGSLFIDSKQPLPLKSGAWASCYYGMRSKSPEHKSNVQPQVSTKFLQFFFNYLAVKDLHVLVHISLTPGFVAGTRGCVRWVYWGCFINRSLFQTPFTFHISHGLTIFNNTYLIHVFCNFQYFEVDTIFANLFHIAHSTFNLTIPVHHIHIMYLSTYSPLNILSPYSIQHQITVTIVDVITHFVLTHHLACIDFPLAFRLLTSEFVFAVGNYIESSFSSLTLRKKYVRREKFFGVP